MTKDYSKLVYNGVMIRYHIAYNSTIEDLGRYYRNVYSNPTILEKRTSTVYLSIM